MGTSLNNKLFLFSIDLEDVRFLLPDGKKFKERVPYNTEVYLKWLDKNKFKCTFFTVGDIAEHYPALIKEIVAEGHEIACHTYRHIPLDKQTKAEFKADLEKNINALYKAGAKKIEGFRAPIFSLTEKTQWAYAVLADLNIAYSSSVFPAKNPLYGWETFGNKIRKVNEKIIEIPMTIGRVGPLHIPYGGGVYFRMLPEFVIKSKIKNHSAADNPLLGYFHPYDIDTEQERFMHPGINESKLYNYLMYYNRSGVFEKLDRIIEAGFTVDTYSNYIHNYLVL